MNTDWLPKACSSIKQRSHWIFSIHRVEQHYPSMVGMRVVLQWTADRNQLARLSFEWSERRYDNWFEEKALSSQSKLKCFSKMWPTRCARLLLDNVSEIGGFTEVEISSCRWILCKEEPEVEKPFITQRVVFHLRLHVGLFVCLWPMCPLMKSGFIFIGRVQDAYCFLAALDSHIFRNSG